MKLPNDVMLICTEKCALKNMVLHQK